MNFTNKWKILKYKNIYQNKTFVLYKFLYLPDFYPNVNAFYKQFKIHIY